MRRDGLHIEPVEVPEKDKEVVLQELRDRGGEAVLRDFIKDIAEKKEEWSEGYVMVIISELYDEDRINLTQIKSSRPGPRQVRVSLKEVEE